MLRLLFTGAGAAALKLPEPGDGDRSGFGEHPASYREVILVPRHGIFPSESQGTF